MKKLLLFFITLVMSAGLKAQCVFQVKSPDEIKGFYAMLPGDSTQGWGNGAFHLKELQAPIAWLGADSLAIDPIKMDLTGKIAIIRRGAIGFAVKVTNAQKAGAVGVIIVNSAATGIQGLGGGLPEHKVPIVSISKSDGDKIIVVLKKGLETIGYIGKKPVLENNLVLEPGYVSGPARRTRPTLLVQEGMVSDTLHAAIINAGSKLQTDVFVLNKIEFENKIIHADTFFFDSIYPGDTLGYFYKKIPFSPKADLAKGSYKLTWYTAHYIASGTGTNSFEIVDMSNDDDLLDNSVVIPFNVSDTISSNVALTSTNLPINSNGFAPSTVASAHGVCQIFQDPYANTMHADAITFGSYHYGKAKMLKDHLFEINVFEWNDQFNNIRDTTKDAADKDYSKFIVSKAWSLIPLVDKQNFSSPLAAYSGFQYVKLDNSILFENNKRYLFCVSTSKADSIGFFFNEDKTNYGSWYREKQATMCLVVDGTYDTRIYSPSFTIVPSLALSVFKNTAASVDNSVSAEATINVYPNPSHDLVNLSFLMDKASDVVVSITDLSGKLLYSNSIKAVSGNNSIPVDVNAIAKGVYVLHISSDFVNATRRIVIEK